MIKNMLGRFEISEHDAPGIYSELVQLNIKRIALIAKLAILFQLTNVLLLDFAAFPYLYYGMGAVVLSSVIFLMIVSSLKHKPDAPMKQLRLIYLIYWIVLALALVPYFAYDALFTHIPTSFIMLVTILVSVPVFSGVESLCIFMGITLCNMAIAILCRAGAPMTVSIALIGAACYVLSYHLHSGYIHIIKKLETESMTDELTGLLNRRAGKERAEAMLALCQRVNQPCAVMMVDIDFFKDYNDCMGHLRGDKALRDVAGAIGERFVRTTDNVFRYGGEEFIVMTLSNDECGALAHAERLRKGIYALHIPAANAKAAEFLTVSVGITLFAPGREKRGCAVDVEKVFACADRALYAAKQTGRNKCVML